MPSWKIRHYIRNLSLVLIIQDVAQRKELWFKAEIHLLVPDNHDNRHVIKPSAAELLLQSNKAEKIPVKLATPVRSPPVVNLSRTESLGPVGLHSDPVWECGDEGDSPHQFLMRPVFFGLRLFFAADSLKSDCGHVEK